MKANGKVPQKSFNQMKKEGKAKKMSHLEVAMKDILDYLELDYVQEPVINIEHLNIEGRKAVNPDFMVGNVAIEMNGNYLHGNPKKYHKLSKIQEKTHKKDLQKLEAYKKLGLDYMIIWEEDLHKNYQGVAKMVEHCLAK